MRAGVEEADAIIPRYSEESGPIDSQARFLGVPRNDGFSGHASRFTFHASLLLGIAITLAARGYQFGGGNHNIYLPAALRVLDPKLLASDWWTTSTLQYHFLFTQLSAGLMRWNLIEPAFLLGYLALVALLHLGWLRLVRALGGSAGTYLVSVVLLYLSAGGYGLGMYEFLQDSAFLPSNVANVAMLWGIVMWIEGRPGAAAACLGLAGMWHLNHAVVGILLWVGLRLWTVGWAPPTASRAPRWWARWWAEPTLLLPCLFTLVPAAGAVLHRSGGLPLADFVDLYVRLRHPHHYDPMSWPAALWAAALWPVPFVLGTRVSSPALFAVRRIAVLVSALLVVATLGAGVWFVSESLVQMSLWRFSIYLKLMGCVGAAVLLTKSPSFRGTPRNPAESSDRLDSSEYLGMTTRPRTGAWCTVAALCLVALAAAAKLIPLPGAAGEFVLANRVALPLLLALCAAARLFVASGRRVRLALLCTALAAVAIGWPKLGLRLSSIPDDNADYLALCVWARDHTRADAVFLVPPQETSFRLHAQRAIVVNFKAVPQLSGELPEWRDRLQAVLDIPDLRELPHRYDRTLVAIAARYAELTPQQLLSAGRRYHATYIVTEKELPARLAHREGTYRVYDCSD